MLVILEIFLIICMLVAYWLSDREITAPAVLFCASFIFSGIWAIAYSNLWELQLHYRTFFVLLFGAVEFTAVSVLVHYAFKKIHWNRRERTVLFPKSDKPRTVFMAGLFLVAAYTTIFTALAMKRITGAPSLSAAISAFRNASVEGQSMNGQLGILYYLGILVRASGYWLAAILGKRIGEKKMPSVFGLLAFAVVVVFGGLSGGRNDIVSLILAAGGAWLITKYRLKKREKTSVKIRRVILALVLVAVGLSLFARMSNLIGRNVDESYFLYYLAIYCGASIKNLDTFLVAPKFGTSPWGRLTFINMIRWLGARFSIPGANYSIALDYNYIKGNELGNVYTTYHAFLSDFGYIGVILLIALMAVICQVLYEAARSSGNSTLALVTYGFVIGLIVFSFFSNKFYEQVFNVNLVKFIICWIALDFFMLRKAGIRYTLQTEGRLE